MRRQDATKEYIQSLIDARVKKVDTIFYKIINCINLHTLNKHKTFKLQLREKG